MSGLPIVKMTLYKHGVGLFSRRGAESILSISSRGELPKARRP